MVIWVTLEVIDLFALGLYHFAPTLYYKMFHWDCSSRMFDYRIGAQHRPVSLCFGLGWSAMRRCLTEKTCLIFLRSGETEEDSWPGEGSVSLGANVEYLSAKLDNRGE